MSEILDHHEGFGCLRHPKPWAVHIGPEEPDLGSIDEGTVRSNSRNEVARTPRGMIREIKSRVNVFNDFKEGRAKIMKVTGNGVVIG